MKEEFNIIVAVGPDYGIGFEGKIPWNIQEDMKRFKEITTTTEEEGKMNAVIMGRKTYLSIPEKFRPLPKRLNIVVSETMEEQNKENVVICKTIEGALLEAWLNSKVDKVFVIGGQRMYEESSKLKSFKTLYLTKVLKNDLKYDSFFPSIEKIEKEFQLDKTEQSKDGQCIFIEMSRKD